MAQGTKAEYEKFVRALRHLNEVHGWASQDYGFGSSLAKQSWSRTLSQAQQEKGFNLVAKYRRVLDSAGISLPDSCEWWDGQEPVQIWTVGTDIFVYSKADGLDGLWQDADLQQHLYKLKEGKAGELLRRMFNIGAEICTTTPAQFVGHTLLNNQKKEVVAPPKPTPPPVVERPKIHIEKEGTLIAVTIPGFQYYAERDVLEHMPSHRLRGNKHYVSARYAFAVERLVRNQPHEAYTEFIADAIATEQLLAEIEDWDAIAPTLAGMEYLRSYQAWSVKMMARQSFLLADDMGLGKTVQSIAASMLKGAKMTVVVCPPVVAYNWKAEIEKWNPGAKAWVCESRGDKVLPAEVFADLGYNYVIIPQSVVAAWQETAIELNPDFLILDEAHNFHNSGTAQSKAVYAIAANAHAQHGADARVIPMTGTPIRNSEIDLQPLLRMVDPAAWSDFSFKARFVDQRRTGIRWHQWEIPNLDDAYTALRPYIIRRMKDSLPDFPGKNQQVVQLDVTDADLNRYNQLEEQVRARIRKDMAEGKYQRGEHLVLINGLRQAAESIKVKTGAGKPGPAVEWIKELNNQGEPVVTFGWFKETTDMLCSALERTVRITGSENSKRKFENAQAFQNGEALNVAAQIKAGGVGITLTAARFGVIVGLPWTAADIKQPADRIHRIGQTRDVTVYIMVALHTIDEWMWDIILNKQRISDRIVDGLTYDETMRQYERSMFSLLIEKLVGEEFFAEHGGEYAIESESSDARDNATLAGPEDSESAD